MKSILFFFVFLLSSSAQSYSIRDFIHPGRCNLEEYALGYLNHGYWSDNPDFGRDYKISCINPKRPNSEIITVIQCDSYSVQYQTRTCCRYMYGINDECWIENYY